MVPLSFIFQDSPLTHFTPIPACAQVGADERAVVDYARAAELDRKNTEGLMKQAKHYYHRG